MEDSSQKKSKIERIKILLEVSQLFLLNIAIIIGGVWTFYTFVILETEKKAKIELREAQQRADQKALLDINLTAQSEPMMDGSGSLIHAKALIKNIGNRNFFLDYLNKDLNKEQSYPLTISKIYFKNDHKYYFEEKSISCKPVIGSSTINDILLMPNEKIYWNFYVKIKEKGYYYLELQIPQEGKERDIHKKTTSNPLGNTLFVEGMVLRVD